MANHIFSPLKKLSLTVFVVVCASGEIQAQHKIVPLPSYSGSVSVAPLAYDSVSHGYILPLDGMKCYVSPLASVKIQNAVPHLSPAQNIIPNPFTTAGSHQIFHVPGSVAAPPHPAP